MTQFIITNKFVENKNASDIITYLIDNVITKILFDNVSDSEKLKSILLNTPENIKSIYFITYDYKIYRLISNFIKTTKIEKIGFINIRDDRDENGNELFNMFDLIADNKYIKKADLSGSISYLYNLNKLFSIKSLKHICFNSSDEIDTLLDNLMENKNLIKITMNGATMRLISEISFALIFNKTLKYLKINDKLGYRDLYLISKMLDINKSLLKIKYNWHAKNLELHNNIQQKLLRNRQLFASIIDNHTRVIFYISEMMEFYVNLPINVYD